MKDEYKIVCKNKKIYGGEYRDSIEEVLDTVLVYDISPPFCVYRNNKDITQEFMEYVKEHGYELVNQEELKQFFPRWIVGAMDKSLKNRIYLVVLFNGKNLKMNTVPFREIKTIEGFYDLYNQNLIPFAYSESCILCLDLSDKAIYMVEKTEKGFNKTFVEKSFTDLRKSIVFKRKEI